MFLNFTTIVLSFYFAYEGIRIITVLKRIKKKCFSIKNNLVYTERLKRWEQLCTKTEQENKEIEKKNQRSKEKWELDKKSFLEEENTKRKIINTMLDLYKKGNSEAIVWAMQKILKKIPKIEIISKKNILQHILNEFQKEKSEFNDTYTKLMEKLIYKKNTQPAIEVGSVSQTKNSLKHLKDYLHLKEQLFYSIYNQILYELHLYGICVTLSELNDEILKKDDLYSYIHKLEECLLEFNFNNAENIFSNGNIYQDIWQDILDKNNEMIKNYICLRELLTNYETYCVIQSGWEKLFHNTSLKIFDTSPTLDMEYNSDTQSLILNYPLPDFDTFCKLPKEVKYNNDEFKINYYSLNSKTNGENFKKIYDSFIYQILFSIINAIFVGDTNLHINSIVVNGFTNTTDHSIGKKVTRCIASIQVSRKEFNEINLPLIEPIQCFKKLKGISAPKLYDLTPVAPIAQISKNDSRFIEGYEVAKKIENGTNLATMHWQDFENLIRELFEWKFNTNGGECKITQASHDGGVDAIAFDPDPILGGKIVIQAKCYTNVVGVSAVRDLYGTLINEGANKGILITTSDYGSDAHKFAKGKPITLLNGNNLLHLLTEMGIKAHINIKEAKKFLKKEKK